MKSLSSAAIFLWCCFFRIGLAANTKPAEAFDAQQDKQPVDKDTRLSDHAPNHWGCLSEAARSLPYCDDSLPVKQRVEDLLNRMTLSEKIAAISPNPELGDTCAMHSSGVDRIGFPPYLWLVETNTMVAGICFPSPHDKSKVVCPTQFPGPLSMGASFNRTSWYKKGEVFGTEQRAMMNIGWTRSDTTAFIGLTGFGPNINQQRDPRFGRSSELPGEDPLLSGLYAANMVKGMQEKDKNGYPKTLAYLKHFTAYSKENDRGMDTYDISMFDLFDTYLAQYEIAFAEGDATGVMCSYNGVNGVPLCANDFLLNKVLRKWKPDAHVATDCGAVHNLLFKPALAPDNETSAAWALMNGTDCELGSVQWTFHLEDAVKRGLATEEAVNTAFQRSYTPHFVAGRFDDPKKSEWFKFGIDDIHTEYHEQIRLEAALQGIVLLKHDHENPVLPLKAGKQKVAVLGPMAHIHDIMSDYWGDQVCLGGGFECVPTLADSIREANPGLTTNASGVDVDSNRTDGIPLALALGRNADVIVLVLGVSREQEHEGLDRTDTALPGKQEMFAKHVFSLGKPVVLVLVNGGQVAMENLVDAPDAIIEAFNPNTIGGTALAKLMYDASHNQWGKLPYTIYPYDVMQSFNMSNYEMAKPPGRTYRYFTGKPVYPFGYGLSLTRFNIDCRRPPVSLLDTVSRPTINIECKVANVGEFAGDEVVQIYANPDTELRLQISSMHPVPLSRLVDFQRVRVEAGEKKKIMFELPLQKAFALVNKHGKKILYSGMHKVQVTNGVMQPIEFDVLVEDKDNELPLHSKK